MNSAYKLKKNKMSQTLFYRLPEGEDPYANDGTPLIDFDSASVSDVSLPLVFRRRDDLKGTQLAQNHYISKELNYWRVRFNITHAF